MAPVKPRVTKPGVKMSSKSSKPTTSKSRVSKIKAPPPKQQKTKPISASANNHRKKKRVYTDEELGLPKLNMITPVGVQKPKGKKKGKVFVDDPVHPLTQLQVLLLYKL